MRLVENGRPHIGITSGVESASWRQGGTAWQPYASAIEEAGGCAVHLAPGSKLQGLEAVLFTGGKDIHLGQYVNPPDTGGEDPDAFMARHRMRPEPERDSYEIPLVREALERDLPILGICRGCQVLNVGLGGRLILDIPLEVDTQLQHTTQPGPDGISSFHEVRIEPGSLLATILPPERFSTINSRHHQAVRRDETLTALVAAVAPEDGLIEAIEVPGRRWAIGVQWHPEHPGDPEIRDRYAPLFRAFVQVAGG